MALWTKIHLSDGTEWQYTTVTKRWTRLNVNGERCDKNISTKSPWLLGLKALTPKDHRLIAWAIEGRAK